jgi:hypothetical protein
MTPAEIREICSQPYYAVICDSCHGHLFREGVLCGKCQGEGRVLVPERRVSIYISRRMLKSALIAFVAMCLLIGAVISILR